MKAKLIILLLAILTTACTPTQILTASAPSATSTPLPAGQEQESGAVFEIPTARAKQCATVTAVESVYIRAEPNASSRVISWLPANEQVKVMDSSGKWWKIPQGYVNSAYLERSECQ